MIFTAITAAVAAAASIAGGIAKTASARRAQRKQQAAIDKMRAENDAWYNRRYNEDATQRADNQRLLTQAREALMRSSRAAAGTSAVNGTSNAAVAAQKEVNNESYAGIVSSVAANAAAQKDSIEKSYREKQASVEQQQLNADMQREANKQAAIDAGVNGVNSVANAIIASHDVSSGKSGDGQTGDASDPTESASVIKNAVNNEHAKQVANEAKQTVDNTPKFGTEVAQKKTWTQQLFA